MLLLLNAFAILIFFIHFVCVQSDIANYWSGSRIQLFLVIYANPCKRGIFFAIFDICTQKWFKTFLFWVHCWHVKRSISWYIFAELVECLNWTVEIKSNQQSIRKIVGNKQEWGRHREPGTRDSEWTIEGEREGGWAEVLGEVSTPLGLAFRVQSSWMRGGKGKSRGRGGSYRLWVCVNFMPLCFSHTPLEEMWL